MFDKKRLNEITNRWQSEDPPAIRRGQHNHQQDKQDIDDLVGMVKDLQCQLALHLDDGSTDDCPGCYMEEVYGEQKEVLRKEIKRLRKSLERHTESRFG